MYHHSVNTLLSHVSGQELLHCSAPLRIEAHETAHTRRMPHVLVARYPR